MKGLFPVLPLLGLLIGSLCNPEALLGGWWWGLKLLTCFKQKPCFICNSWMASQHCDFVRMLRDSVNFIDEGQGLLSGMWKLERHPNTNK